MKNEFDFDSGQLDEPRPATFNEPQSSTSRSVFSTQPLFPVSFADGRTNRRKWGVGLALGVLALSAVGISFAQQNQSSLPAPPAMPAPAAIAPRPDGARPDAPPAPPHLADGDRPAPDGPTAKGGPRDDHGSRPGEKPQPGQGPRNGEPRNDGPREGGPRPGGPGPDGFRPDGPRPEDANTQAGASHALERAYRAASEVGTPNGEARDLSAAARTFYARGIQAFAAKQYPQAFALAESSDRLSHSARALSSDAPPAPATVPGLTPPPIAAAPVSDANSAIRELNRNYDEWNRSPNKDIVLSNRLRALSEANYRAALQAYNAKQFADATTRAHQGAEQAKAARDYAEALAL